MRWQIPFRTIVDPPLRRAGGHLTSNDGLVTNARVTKVLNRVILGHC